jgi:type IV secretion system protein VirB8
MAISKEAEAYFAEASRWEADRALALTATARRAWIVAAAAIGAALLATAAVAMLTPLKRVEPFVVRVDSSTGIVDVVPGYSGTEPLPEAVTRHLVTQYVIQRERYIAAIAEADYEQVGAYHNASMNQSWAAAWAKSNPESPLNRFADGAQVHVQVRSVSFLRQNRDSPELVQVRFAVGTQHGAAGAEEHAHFVATLQVTYGAPSADVRLRALNPLGFKVLEYRRESEAVEPEPVPAVTGTAASPASPAGSP